MNRLWILFAGIVGIAVALPTHPHREAEQIIQLFQDKQLGRNNAIESLIIEALEDLRTVMTTGSDTIPVLDPMQVDRIYLDDSTVPIPGAHLELTDLLVSKLSTFEVSELSVESTSVILQRYRAQIQLEVPLIDVEVGQYDLLVDVFGLTVFGKGDAKISVTKPWIRVDANANIRLGWLAMFLNISELRFDVGLDDIHFELTGIFNDPTVSDFVNRFLRNLILELAEFWADDISDLVSPIVLDVANDILSDINLIDIIT